MHQRGSCDLLPAFRRLDEEGRHTVSIHQTVTRSEMQDDESPFVDCPECGLPAHVEWRAELASTDGPVEHVKIRCISRHWFFMPADTLT